MIAIHAHRTWRPSPFQWVHLEQLQELFDHRSCLVHHRDRLTLLVAPRTSPRPWQVWEPTPLFCQRSWPTTEPNNSSAPSTTGIRHYYFLAFGPTSPRLGQKSELGEWIHMEKGTCNLQKIRWARERQSVSFWKFEIQNATRRLGPSLVHFVSDSSNKKAARPLIFFSTYLSISAIHLRLWAGYVTILGTVPTIGVFVC